MKKPMTLYLLIPTHSAHPHGVLSGHMFGNILMIYCLNSDVNHITKDKVTFYRPFLTHGQKCDVLKPLFLKAIENTRKFIATGDGQRDAIKIQKLKAASRRIYLHIEHHAQTTPSNQSDVVL